MRITAGLFDYEYQLDEIKKHQPSLQKLNQIIDWELFHKPLENAFINENRKSNIGRKPQDKLLFKIFKTKLLTRANIKNILKR